VLKYPWSVGGNPESPKKWGYYSTERSIVEWARAKCGHSGFVRSAEAEIMDWADDITYAIHDLIDFYCAGLIPLHLFLEGTVPEEQPRPSTKECERFLRRTFEREGKLAEEAEANARALLQALEVRTIDSPYDGTQPQKRDLWSFSSILITRYVNSIRLIDPASDPRGRWVAIDPEAKRQTDMLRQLTWDYVILNSDLRSIQYGQERMIGDLFKVCVDRIVASDFAFFPRGFSELIRAEEPRTTSPARWAADFISGLTEREVYRLHERLIRPTA